MAKPKIKLKAEAPEQPDINDAASLEAQVNADRAIKKILDAAKPKSNLAEELSKPAMTFSLTHEEQIVINDWHQRLQKRLLKEKKANQHFGGDDEVYYGAIGGGLTYSFIPTSMGDILIVTEAISKEELNVTNALRWKNFD